MMKKIGLVFVLFLMTKYSLHAQLPNPSLVGYWHNWNDVNAPYIPLNAIDNRYNVIEIAFAVPTSPSDMTMTFAPTGNTQNDFIAHLQSLQSQGKKVLLSIGGAGVSIDLTTLSNKNAFVSSITSIVDTYGFDGIDIDIESGNSILIAGGTIDAPVSVSQLNLIEAIEQIMSNFRASNNYKMLLTMAPETAYVQGGQSAFGNIWGGYLPIIDALRDSLDLLQVQLYNSGTMYGIDGGIYTQGTADFIVAMTEAVISGFNTSGGQFFGLPPEKIAIGLPACSSAGGGFIDSAIAKQAIDYLLGNGPAPGAYTLQNANAYPNIRGMMTWSINWDAVSTCESAYNYASNFEQIFTTLTKSSNQVKSSWDLNVFPNPSNDRITIVAPASAIDIEVSNIYGESLYKIQNNNTPMHFDIASSGIYFISAKSKNGVITKKIIVNK
jgi:chitinase